MSGRLQEMWRIVPLWKHVHAICVGDIAATCVAFTINRILAGVCACMLSVAAVWELQ